MTTLTKITLAIILSIMMTSCQFDLNFNNGVQGNGNVTTIERTLEDSFHEIEVSRGMDVYLTQSDTPMLKVQTDENLHNLIITEIENGVLKIYTSENISTAEAKKVMVNVNQLKRISSTSGSDVYSTNTIFADDIALSTTSGADLELALEATSTTLSSTSGSDLNVTGKTVNLKASATSGSDIRASQFQSETCEANATSGADIELHVSKKLTAKANSGGDIRYVGNPELLEKNGVTSGSVRKM